MKPAPFFTKFDKPSAALEAAKSLIKSVRRWTTGVLARTDTEFYGNRAEGQMCTTKSKFAEAFCALGAVKRVNGPAEKAATAYLREAGKQLLHRVGRARNEDIFTINDSRGHKSVMNMFTLAIRAAKKDGK